MALNGHTKVKYLKYVNVYKIVTLYIIIIIIIIIINNNNIVVVVVIRAAQYWKKLTLQYFIS